MVIFYFLNIYSNLLIIIKHSKCCEHSYFSFQVGLHFLFNDVYILVKE